MTALARHAEPGLDRAALLLALGRSFGRQSDWKSAVAAFDEARLLARDSDAIDLETEALALFGMANAHLGNVDDAVEALQHARRIADRAGRSDLAAHALSVLHRSHVLLGRHAEALSTSMQLIDRLNERDPNRLTPKHQLDAATHLVQLGMWNEAVEYLIVLERTPLEDTDRCRLLTILGSLDALRGNYGESEQRLNAAAALYEHLGTAALLVQLANGQALLDILRANPTAALRVVREALSELGDDAPMLYTCRLHGRGTRAAVEAALEARARRDVLGARRMELVAEFHHSQLAAMARRAQESEIGLQHELHAHERIARGERSRLATEAANDAWTEAIAAWEQRGHPHELAYVLYRHAEQLVNADNDSDGAAEHIIEARAIATALHAVPLRAAIEALASASGIRFDDDLVTAHLADDPCDVLSKREREVLALVARGYTNNQIAEAFFLSVRTVSSHVGNILTKLEVSNRTEAALVARESALIPSAPTTDRQLTPENAHG